MDGGEVNDADTGNKEETPVSGDNEVSNAEPFSSIRELLNTVWAGVQALLDIIEGDGSVG